MQVQSLVWEDSLESAWQPMYSCLENPMNRGLWWVIVHGVPQSQDTAEVVSHECKQSTYLKLIMVCMNA